MTAPLRVDVDGAVATVTLDRPTYSYDLERAWHDALDTDPAIRCVVLTGSGDTFCTGFDPLFFAFLIPASSLAVLK